jgi:hypothetical protein
LGRYEWGERPFFALPLADVLDAPEERKGLNIHTTDATSTLTSCLPAAVIAE